MKNYMKYASIIICDDNADLEELDNHLTMNGYDFGIDTKRGLLFVSLEEVEYVETILRDRKIVCARNIY